MRSMRASPDAADAYSHYSLHRLAMRVRVNPVDCVGPGLCGEPSPEWVQLDGERPPELVDHPVWAAQVCPTPALPLESARE